MKKHIAIMCLLVAITSLTACSNILEGSVEVVADHEVTPYVRPPVELPAVSDFDELRELMMQLIVDHEEGITVQYFGIDGDTIQEEAQNAADKILRTDPVAAYAVTDITVTSARIISYSEVSIDIVFKRTAEQVQSRVQISTPRNMITPLLDAMSRYRAEAVFLTDLHLDSDDIVSQVAEIYYQNPRRVVMMPIVTLEVYPEPAAGESAINEPGGNPENGYRIYEIKFGYTYTEDMEMLRSMSDNLDSSVRRNAARAGGDNDGEIILSLVENLIASADYDEGTAGTIAAYGTQNIAATAYGALVSGSAVGEGFAMAFKALCDELRIDCRVVLGAKDDKYHAWNIVMLDGHYYHIDAAMCAENGLEAGFLRTDEDIEELLYIWDTSSVPQCDGPLTLKDLLPPPEDEQGEPHTAEGGSEEE